MPVPAHRAAHAGVCDKPVQFAARYDWFFAAAHYTKHGETDADAEKGDGRRLRDWSGCGGSQEAVETSAALKKTDDLPHVVDAESLRKECARRVDWGEAAVGVEEEAVDS